MRIKTKGDGPRGEILNENGDILRTRRDTILMAKELRANQTDAEDTLWNYLRGRKQNGCKFYRQHPIGRYVADFYCPKRKLIIELDGGVHDAHYQQEHDALRDKALRLKGCRILRFRNDEIIRNTDAVLQQISTW